MVNSIPSGCLILLASGGASPLPSDIPDGAAGRFSGASDGSSLLKPQSSVDALVFTSDEVQAGTYSAAMHFLKSVKAAGTKDAKAAMTKMKELPISDFMTRDRAIRNDGRVIRNMYLLATKDPSDSKGEWDLMKVVTTIPGTDAFRPLGR